MSSQAQADPFSAAHSVGSEEQRRVDAIVAEAKAGVRRAPPSLAPAPPFHACPATIDRRLSEELDYVRRLLDSMGEQFASDPTILQRHARSMQGFDLAGQILGHISKVLAAADKSAAIDGIGMQELRVRLKRQAL